MSPLTPSERIGLAVAVTAVLLLVAYVALGTPLLGVVPALAAVAWVVSRTPTDDRVRLAVGSLATVTAVGAGVPALVFDTDLTRGFDGTARLWVAVAGGLAVLWLCLAALDRRIDAE